MSPVMHSKGKMYWPLEKQADFWLRLWSAEENRSISAELVLTGQRSAETHWKKYGNPGTSTAVIEGIEP